MARFNIAKWAKKHPRKMARARSKGRRHRHTSLAVRRAGSLKTRARGALRWIAMKLGDHERRISRLEAKVL